MLANPFQLYHLLTQSLFEESEDPGIDRKSTTKTNSKLFSLARKHCETQE